MSDILNRRKRGYNIIKRFLDISGSIAGMILLSPIFTGLFLLVWIINGWPVFFTQERPGQDGRIFRMIKFRTMTNKCDEKGNILPDKERTTYMGRLIRKASLDELPEFFNVLKGDMSIVGPRPLLVKYLPYYTEREKQRHNVRPGITGLSQVNGRNLLTWDKRLEMDVQYVEKLSFRLDIKIVLQTIHNVIRQKDVLAVSSEQIPDFDDYRKTRLNKRADVD